MKTENAWVGARVVDSLPYSNSGIDLDAGRLKAAGADAVAGYLGAMTKSRLGWLLDAGLAYVPVTFAGEYMDGAGDELFQLGGLGIPVGTTVFLDLEGKKAFDTEPGLLANQVNAWATAIEAARYIPGLYVGSPQPFTETELWKLGVRRYWQGQGATRDRFGKLAEPTGCGWCMRQMFPSVSYGGVLVDHNMVGQDYKGRLPTWVVS
ncbi:hypothetical protein [Acidithiobacillus sp.]|uniref:hypothetical protein n=1 Tax=Acidithiobacillus sp. TaxID=1872118 RepID=UPI00258AC54A|nr:hypothetical protein [Acidithiobacillus sp.]MDD5374463.1 hypothetical protein [Acidithiobacillus sp.]